MKSASINNVKTMLSNFVKLAHEQEASKNSSLYQVAVENFAEDVIQRNQGETSYAFLSSFAGGYIIEQQEKLSKDLFAQVARFDNDGKVALKHDDLWQALNSLSSSEAKHLLVLIIKSIILIKREDLLEKIAFDDRYFDGVCLVDDEIVKLGNLLDPETLEPIGKDSITKHKVPKEKPPKRF